MRPWQAAIAGLFVGIVAAIGVGATGFTEQPNGPYFQISPQEIVDTSHIQTATLAQTTRVGEPTVAPPMWLIQLTFQNGKTDNVGFDTENQAKESWRKLQGLLGVEQTGSAR